jgi:hypothetical protein
VQNWFQNRRAKVKQDAKKQQNQYNMSMGIYGTPQVQGGNAQFPLHMEQPQQPRMTHEFYPANADISPASLPIQALEASALELGGQLTLQQQPYDMHALRSIPEADRTTSYHPNAIMQSIMAATAGASYMHQQPASMAPPEPVFSFEQNGLPQSFPGELAFSVPNTLPNEHTQSNDVYHVEFDGLEFNPVASNPLTSAEVQNSTGSISSDQSTFSRVQSTATSRSSTGPAPSSVNSLASVFSNYTDDQKTQSEFAQVNEGEDQFAHPYSVSQAAASDHALPLWGSNGQLPAFSQADMYQPNASPRAVLSSPEQSDDSKATVSQLDFDSLPTFGDDAYSRRNSSTTNLASNIEAIHIQNSHTPDGFKQPNQPSSIAARRQKRPTALNSSTLRSASFTSGMSSPGANSEHTLRRIRSSGIANATGRIQKPCPGSAQRSPMAASFAEAAASPKFSRTFSASGTATIGQGGSLAPPTPLTPNEMGRFPYWQGNAVVRNHAPMPEHSTPESLNAPYSMEPPPAGDFVTSGSPPSTPLDLAQWNQARVGGDMYRDTPPQSAPATQQSFPRPTFVPPPQMRAGFYSTSDLTIAQPKPSHFRRPSLPDSGPAQAHEAHMQFPLQLRDMYDGNFGDMSFNGITHNVPFAPPAYMSDFFIHEYPRTQGPGENILRGPAEPPQKNYVFANQGPGDFR